MLGVGVRYLLFLILNAPFTTPQIKSWSCLTNGSPPAETLREAVQFPICLEIAQVSQARGEGMQGAGN